MFASRDGLSSGLVRPRLPVLGAAPIHSFTRSADSDALPRTAIRRPAKRVDGPSLCYSSQSDNDFTGDVTTTDFTGDVTTTCKR